MTALWLTFARWSTAALLAFSSALGLAIVLVLGSIAIYVLPVQVNAAGIATLMICLIFVVLVLGWRRWTHNQYARALMWGLTIPACVGGWLWLSFGNSHEVRISMCAMANKNKVSISDWICGDL